MRRFLALLITMMCGIAAGLAIAFPAAAACGRDVSEVRSYLSAHPGWSSVEPADLPGDDRALWAKYHAGLCPGVAVVNLDGHGPSFALALLHGSRGGLVETLVLLRIRGSRLAVTALRGPVKVTSPFVVWRTGPERAVDEATGKTVRTLHDSIVYEKMEATSTAYYLSDGRIRSLLASD
jgi:hypothetical protein